MYSVGLDVDATIVQSCDASGSYATDQPISPGPTDAGWGQGRV
jgi:hypothetical protein